MRSFDNYYAASRESIDYLGFVLDRSVFPFEQFDLKLNRPDIILNRLGQSDPEIINAFHNAYRRRLSSMGLTESDLTLNLSLVPELKITGNKRTAKNDYLMEVYASGKGTPIIQLKVDVDDVPLYGRNGVNIGQGATELNEKMKIPLCSGRNKIQVSVMNQRGVESLKQTVFVSHELLGQKPNLYLVAIGVSDFVDQAMNLDYAAKDARDVIQLFQDGNRQFNRIVTKELINTEAIVSKLDSVRSMLEKTNVDDRVIIFISSHGIIDPHYRYYLATHDMNFEQPEQKGLAFEKLENLLDGIPARKKLLLIDACHSGELDIESSNAVKRNAPYPRAIKI